MRSNNEIIEWLMEGDISIQYQVYRDLLNSEKKLLRQRIEDEGWGAAFLSHRLENGHWGRGFYQPKWTSTHYSLLDLKNLSIAQNNSEIKQTLDLIFKFEKGPDGGINPSRTINNSDVCINGMVLNYSSYFGVEEAELKSIVDFLISQHMKDGGFNCHSNRKGAIHSSLHTTLSVAEGILEYSKNGYRYRTSELQKTEQESKEFILQHKFFKSDRTGKIIDKKMLMLSYPSRWRYDILRALDYFQFAGVDYDNRMEHAIAVLLKKRRKNGKWPLQAKHPGQAHFDMEKSGEPSRWNTLRALRVLKRYPSNP
ncbi:MAG: hypothetical protein KAU48_06960 [Candidatus Thorarchaeota archaeon]|nr:hypothetical protein [Candidatus Thorarchaeota archaeon]